MKIAILTNDSLPAKYFVGKLLQMNNETIDIYIEKKIKKKNHISLFTSVKKELKKYKRFFMKQYSLSDIEMLMERRARKRYFPDFKKVIQSVKMPKNPVDIHSKEFLNKIEASSYDIIILFGTSIVGQSLISLPKVGMLNIHSSLLPYYKGTMPEFWQLYFQDYAYCGVTIHYVENSVDTGNILLQKSIQVEDKDTFYDLRYKNILAAIELIPDAIKLAKEGNKGKVQESVTQEVFRFSMITDEKKKVLYRRLGWSV